MKLTSRCNILVLGDIMVRLYEVGWGGRAFGSIGIWLLFRVH